MRFHCLAVPHTISNSDYVACAYTQKVVKFCKMMKQRGHYIIHYGHEDSVVECDENVSVVSKETFNELYGNDNYKHKFFEYDTKNSVYQEFHKNAIEEVGKRKEKNDFLLAFWGYGVKDVCDAHSDMICVEPGIGYTSAPFCKWAVFESYALLHSQMGIQKVSRCNPEWYWSVIPNYFDIDDFEYSSEKEDYFLFVGRVYDGKGIHIAIQVTKQIGAKLLVCGQNNLKDCGYTETPDHVTEIGYVGKEKRKELMSKAKGAVIASLYTEPFGGVQIEMLLSGTPTITTDWGAFTENNIHGITGYRCRTFEHFCWAAKNIENISPENCRNFGLNFTLDKVGKMYEEYFKSVLDVFETKDGWYRLNDDRQELNYLTKNLNISIP